MTKVHLNLLKEHWSARAMLATMDSHPVKVSKHSKRLLNLSLALHPFTQCVPQQVAKPNLAKHTDPVALLPSFKL